MKRVYLHPVPVRIWHWVHALGILLLVLTGFQLRFADHLHWISFRTAVVVHAWIGILVSLDFLLWLGYYLGTGKIRVYLPRAYDLLKGAWKQARYYAYGIFVGEENPFHPEPENKFNALQKMTYLAIMGLLVPLQVITGILLLNTGKFAGIIEALGGLKVVDAVHVVLFYVFAAFIIAHFYLASLGPTFWSHFKAMITGWEEEPEEG